MNLTVSHKVNLISMCFYFKKILNAQKIGSRSISSGYRNYENTEESEES